MEKSRIKGRNETSVSSFSSPVPYGKDTHFPCIEGRGGGRWLARARTLGVLLGVTASLCDICDLSGRTTRIHGHRWSSEEEEKEKNFFLNFAILSLLSLSSFFIRLFGGREKIHGGTKDLRIFCFVETSISLLRGAFFFGTYMFACFLDDRTSVYLGLDEVLGRCFLWKHLTRGRTLCFLARENQLRGMRSRRNVVREMVSLDFGYIYIM